MNKWDISEKKTLEIAAESWVKWILSDHDIEIKEQLSGEFQYVMRISDVIMKARGKKGEFIVFTEFQLRYSQK
ncbi:MAG: hypothetical protein ACE5J3_12035 [Methanosarcinales archaeon]